MLKVLFVINPRAGNREGGSLELSISEESRTQGFEYLIYRLQSSNEEKNIKKEIAAYSPDIVAVAGGDGTVNLLAKILNSEEMPLLIVPLGSANGMARELKISNRPESSLALITSGIQKKIDLLSINGNICIHLGDVGLNASIVKRFEKDPKRGLWTYARHLFKELFLIDDYKFNINVDNQQIKRRAVSVTFANASKYGTGAVINPLGKLDDGKFELVIIKPFPKIHLLSITWKMFVGRLQTSEFVEVLSCEKAVIQTSKKTTLQIDGEIIGKTKEINVEVLPSALTIIVPSEY
ncbi:diacylglycerol/lipid kinase family protein [Paradesertivirga mongoliensis]|uniref:Diacylglycerol/lipid kinase family protein n=1 Tax=Paradesertivirga mongoliensis TaxID=2100740 RepID=A0ABW4ZNR3_9SPHI|nr:diacylglycerol kinase family protein [Pedobacter mongoliensis]